MNYVLDESGFPLNSYNSKKLKILSNLLPVILLIQIDETDLYYGANTSTCFQVCVVKTKIVYQQDWAGSFINIIIFMPRNRLTPDVYNTISNYLSQKFDSEIITDNITIIRRRIFLTFCYYSCKR